MLIALFVTWLFWTAISLWNFGFLAGLSLWPVAMISIEFYGRFIEFAWSPLLAAIFAAAAIAVLLRVKSRSIGFTGTVLAVNTAFLAAFVLVAEARRAWIVSELLAVAQPDCSYSRSFLSALRNAGDELGLYPHALYVKDEAVFIFSYRELDFIAVPQTIWQNLSFESCSANRPSDARIG